jgi:hypothetical protein
MKRSGIFLIGATVAVIAASVAGLFVLGSPGDERSRRVDERRGADLRGIMEATDLYWTRHSRLPASLDELSTEPGVTIGTSDPVSGDRYTYQPLDTARYEICATFELESREVARGPEDELWAHGPGRQCFEMKAEEIERRDP